MAAPAALPNLLIYYATQIRVSNLDATIHEYLLPSGDWDLPSLSGILPVDILDQIGKMKPSHNTLDRVVWTPSSDRCFSVKSAYQYLDAPTPRPWTINWKSMWNCQIPERLKFFMWQASHGRLVTNSLRCRRHLSNTNLCPYECPHEETVVHTLRDCVNAREV